MQTLSARADGSRVEIGAVIYLTLLGLAVRLAAPLMSAFPLNDGGLFYSMIVDLQANGFDLPLTTTYSAADIPLAYPPLAFYLTAFFSKISGVPVLDLLRILPAVFSGLAIPVFYLLAKELAHTKLQALLAILAFAFLPRTFEWHVTGGGITRSLGFIFAILTLVFVLRLYKNTGVKNTLFCILFGALTLLTHPEAAVHTAISAGVFYLWTNRSGKGLVASLGIALGVLSLSSPWWLTVILRHGTGPFQAAFAAVGADSVNLLARVFVGFLFVFTDEPYLTLISVFALIGLFASLVRRASLLPVWMFILYLLEPRGGPLYMMLPISLLAGLGLDSVILSGLIGQSLPDDAGVALRQILNHKSVRWFLVFLFTYMFMSAFVTGERLRQDFSLRPADVDALHWVRDHTPTSSAFAVVTGEPTPFRDPWSEWFPAITGRKSLATIFGYEWVHDGKFAERIQIYNDLQACAWKDIACLAQWETDSGLGVDYVYIQKEEPNLPLQSNLDASGVWQLVYETESARIYQRVR
jgi:hypothetical protein